MRLLGALAAAVCVFMLVGWRGGHLDRFGLGGRRRNRLSRQAWLAQAGLSVTPAQFAAISALSGMAAMALAWAVSGALAIGLVPAIAAGFAPRAWYAKRRKARLNAVTEAWPDGILHVLGALRSGLSVHGATVDLTLSGPGALREAFANYEAWARVSSPAAALVRVREQLAEPVSDKAIGVLIEANRHGTDVALSILAALAEDIRADERIGQQIRQAQQEPRLTGAIAFGFPWLALLFSCAAAPEVRDYYATGAGHVVLLLGAALSLSNLVVILRLSREDPEPRVVGEAS